MMETQSPEEYQKAVQKTVMPLENHSACFDSDEVEEYTKGYVH